MGGLGGTFFQLPHLHDCAFGGYVFGAYGIASSLDVKGEQRKFGSFFSCFAFHG
jgi:hypothetical protein